MTLLDWLRRLGILRFGAEGAVYHNAQERPMSLLADNVFNSDKDVIDFNKKSAQNQAAPDSVEECSRAL